MLETLRTATSLAVSLRKAGEQTEAMNLAQDTYERYKRRYGSDTPDAQSCALNLACDYAAVDDMPRALELVTEVKAAHQAALGKDHPNTLVAANNLACYLRCLGGLPEALALAEDTLDRMRHQAGRHASADPLLLGQPGQLPRRLRRPDQSRGRSSARPSPLLRDRLGGNHPDTLVCQANLTVTLRASGQEKEAEELRARLLADVSRVLGPGHPDIAQLQKWQRINRDLEPQQI